MIYNLYHIIYCIFITVYTSICPFYNEYIKNKYTKYLIILDNARFHKSHFVKENIINSDNKIIYSLVYNPNLNPIENLFSQLKNHIKNKSPDNYEQLKNNLDYIIKNKVSKEHLENNHKAHRACYL